MSLFEFGRIIYRYATYLFVIPILLAVLIFIFTINQKKQYASSALLYTGLASGFDIESGTSDKVDYHAVNNAFDNMISIVESKQTVEEVLLRMLATHIDARQKEKTIPKIYQEYLSEYLPVAQQKRFHHFSGVDSTYLQLDSALNNYDPLLINIIRGENGLYSSKLLKTLEVKRHKSSDMLKLYYTAKNPAICKQVVELVIHVFSNRYKAIKVAETGDVVGYFQTQLNMAKARLNKAEDKLTDFRTRNRVINYVEQTKAIAIKKQNALEEYSNKKMNLLATQVALNEIENKLEIREDLLSKNSDLLDKRNRLAELVQQMARTQSSDNTNGYQKGMKKEIEDLKKGIQEDLEVVFSYSNSKEGLPNRQLLTQWLEYVISLNREKANVAYFKKWLDELDALYDNFAPLGSTLARLEREISVSEREYLEILNALNISKLRQQNIQMSSKLEVVDWPQLPINALASKRKLLVIIGFLFGLISIVTFLIAREFLDNSISTPSKAEKATKLMLIGAFPLINEKLEEEYPNLLSRIKSLSITKLISDKTSSKLITIFSAYEGEGKKAIANLLATELREGGIQVNIVRPFNEDNQLEENVQTYISDSKLNQVNSLNDLKIKKLNGFTILILPALTNGKIPYGLIKSADESIMITRADKAWSVTQAKAIKDWKKKVGKKPFLILNGVKTFNLEEFIGEIGTKHNFLVKWLRKVAKFEFDNSAFSTL
jgi:succinoglycan biosynthesis transport protein ExoP